VSARVVFVGAGPGAPDLLTFRAASAIAAADVVVWAASLVNEAIVTAHARPGAEIHDSSVLTLEAVFAIYDRARESNLTVARVHSGDPTLYGAIQEQIDYCDAIGLRREIVPGVSSLAAAAAVLGRELTVPGVAQSVVLTRIAGRTSTMPAGESVASFAQHATTMALFLSAGHAKLVQGELLEGGYPPHTPCAIVYRASWPDEVVIRTTVAKLASQLRKARIHKTALILVGPALGPTASRSDLYSPQYGHEFRKPLSRARRGGRVAADGAGEADAAGAGA
jgi:precorrin-4/cobalt-precorrin-4 C11-methyltransferase